MDAVGAVLMLWRRRKWLGAWVAATTLAGIAYALLASPAYYSEATISPRDADENRGSGLLSQLGGVGGVIAARMAGNTNNLEKVEIILKSNDLAEDVIRKHDLLPMLFPDQWDARARRWKDVSEKDRPTLRKGMKKLKDDVLGVTVNVKKNVITVRAVMGDSVQAKQMVEYYVSALNDRIRADVTRSTEIDRAYLEGQMSYATDPVLREKVQGLIASQIEKSMLVRNQAFDMVEKPLVPMMRSSPKRKRIVILSFAFGVFSSLAGMFAWNAIVRFVGQMRARAAAGS